MKSATTICVLFAAAFVTAGAVASRADNCSKADFETVVEDAAKALRDLNQRNRNPFQNQLRLLKQKQAWSDEQFMKEAAIYVQDDKITALDQRSGDLLSRINQMGSAGATGSGEPDCKLLAELKATMKALVDTQIEKWRYMFAKLDQALKP